MEYTPRYNFCKPAEGEYADIAVLNENMDKVEEALENQAEIVIGDAEPRAGPVLWFNTAGRTSDAVLLLLGAEGQPGTIMMQTDTGSYPVENAALNGEPQDKPYNFKII